MTQPTSDLDMRQRLIKDYSTPQTLRSLWIIFRFWSVVGLSIFLSAVIFPPLSSLFGLLMYLAILVLIASQQHALGVLTHEGVHFGFSKNRTLNDWITRVFFAFPFFVSLSKYRLIHWEHHRHTYQALDPDIPIYKRYPIEQHELLRLLKRDMMGMNVYRNFKYFADIPFVTDEFNARFLGEKRAALHRADRDIWSFYGYWLCVLGIGTALGGLIFWKIFLFYWLLPYVTFAQLILRLRGAIEHGNVPNPQDPYQSTRTYIVHPLLGFLLAPYNVNFHLEHHLYPTVCWNHLPQLHEHLTNTEYDGKSPFIQTFKESLRALIRPKNSAGRNL